MLLYVYSKNRRAHFLEAEELVWEFISQGLEMEEASSSVSDDQKNSAAVGRNADPWE